MNPNPFPQTLLPVSQDQSAASALPDAFGRPLNTLRLSVTDRCNFRCRYCMPSSQGQPPYRFSSKNDYLSVGEHIRLVKILVKFGIRKIRITGGEPLLSPQLIPLIRELSVIREIRDLALTTNGLLLNEYAPLLKRAGLHRLTVSLDSLDPAVLRKMRGRHADLQKILTGIRAAAENGFSPVKINTVIRRGLNESDILKMTKFFHGTPHVLRFIEYMDVGTRPAWQLSDVVPSQEIIDLISKVYPLDPMEPQEKGDVARLYRFRDGGGVIGFISAVTQPFCQTCNRLRLSCEGKIYTCLFSGEGLDLRSRLRAGASDDEIKKSIQLLWRARADKYSENRAIFRVIQENIQKIEMHQIGG